MGLGLDICSVEPRVLLTFNPMLTASLMSLRRTQDPVPGDV